MMPKKGVPNLIKHDQPIKMLISMSASFFDTIMAAVEPKECLFGS